MERRQRLYLLRHGETEWSKARKHTGRTDIPLTDRGREDARRLERALVDLDLSLVLTSPLQRAAETCRLAGFADRAQSEPDLMEWDYGEYEGLTTPEIRRSVAGWNVFTHGCPGGEQPEEVARRADRVIARVREVEGDAALFGHGHLLRVVGARWLTFPPVEGRRFVLQTGTISVVGYEHDMPAILRWNAPVD